MIWIEMSRDEVHGGGDWGFSKCIWSPSRKKDGARWGFWTSITKVKAGDTIIHLRGKGATAAFTGTSKASCDGYLTDRQPLQPGGWAFSPEFFRVDLEDYRPFSFELNLNRFFKENEEALYNLFRNNKALHKSKKRLLFFVAQANRLQCLNGAYFSEGPEELINLILDSGESIPSSEVLSSVETGENYSMVKQRVGQQNFSASIKDNYGQRCCFPGCNIDDPAYLIGAHIVRWADSIEKRGKLDNGLCLCLLHDKAFERGSFTLSDSYEVRIPKDRSLSTHEAQMILPWRGQRIRLGDILPDIANLEIHRVRTSMFEK